MTPWHPDPPDPPERPHPRRDLTALAVGCLAIALGIAALLAVAFIVGWKVIT